MSNTAIAAIKGTFIEISFAGSGAAWDMTTDTKIPVELRNRGFLNVDSITFVPSAANDICIITEGPGSGGPAIFYNATKETTSGVVQEQTKGYNHKKMTPYFDLSRSTLGTAANAKILIELA